ncbi:MAG: hypothetical protein ABSD58_19735 [Verrucomicrobiia bacterium]|jgi:hypothetical protein
MRPVHIAITFALLSLVTACSTTRLDQRDAHNTKSPPESVMVTYHVKPGTEAEFQHVLADVWAFYRKERLVLAQPHLIARSDDGPGNTRFVEIFTWVSHSAPEHVPASVGKLWDQMQSLCEPRNGQPGIDISEIDLVTPPSH